MKKAKIMLASMAILAVVGSSLAFKANKFGAIIWTGTAPNDCLQQTVNFTLTDEPVGDQLYVTTIDPSIVAPNCSFSFTTTAN